MAGGIKISTAEVRATASTIRNLNNKMNQDLTDIQKAMAGLKSSWQSEGGDAIQSKFSAAANKYFSSYHDVVESYAKFLENVVSEGYEKTETTITSNADAFE